MKALAMAGVLAAAATVYFAAYPEAKLHARTLPGPARVEQGSLLIRDGEGRITGESPLKHTDVKAEIAGFLARVTVTQEFENTAKDKVEAVYVFPLPHRAAVDAMTMHVGDRVVKGVIKRREEARALYEAARSGGKVASLLDQERPNIFTQHVANIMPGAKVKLVLSYVETLKYEAGTYEFVFPMVVGPRYIPGVPKGKLGGGWAHDTDQVPDACRKAGDAGRSRHFSPGLARCRSAATRNRHWNAHCGDGAAGCQSRHSPAQRQRRDPQ
jgi:hypothetical protein